MKNCYPFSVIHPLAFNSLKGLGEKTAYQQVEPILLVNRSSVA